MTAAQAYATLCGSVLVIAGIVGPVVIADTMVRFFARADLAIILEDEK